MEKTTRVLSITGSFGGLLPPKDEVGFALDAFQSAQCAAQDGLAGIIAGLAESQVMIAGRTDSTQDKLDELKLDIEKVFKRLQQLEARQVSLVDNRDAKLQKQLQNLEEASAASRLLQEELREEVAEQRNLLSKVRSRKEEASVEEPECTGTSLLSEEAKAQLINECQQLESKVMTMMETQKISLENRMDRLEGRLMERLKVLDAGVVESKEKAEASAGRVRSLEQRYHRQSSELKKVVSILEVQGFLSEAEKSEKVAIVDRVASLEAHLSDSKELIHSFQDRFSTSMTELDDGLHRLEKSLEGSAELPARFDSLWQSHEALAREYADKSEFVMTSLEELSQVPQEVSALETEFKALRIRQERTDDDVSRLVRLGRILDDKVEIFDSMERRMEELNTNAQKLMGAQFASSVRCLSCTEIAGDEAARPRGRTPSPPRTCIVNQQFEALRDFSPSPPPAGWSRPSSAGALKPSLSRPSSAGCRRPQSAGVKRSCEQQLSQQEPSENRPQTTLVLSVPQVRTEIFSAPKPGSIGAVCGTAISAVRGEHRAPKPAQRNQRPMSARARMQISAHQQDRLAGS
mmetsp:Transcript_31480/g.57187  ORF Transcript_31480/g.57187 Transcript_31480/m.57187 type:complete len:577 (-) Transcript_31480:111-1841(-)